MIKNYYLFGALCVVMCAFFFGCAVKTPQAKKVSVGSVAETKKTGKEKHDPCKIVLDEAVKKSRKTMLTVRESCQGMQIEVNPMWDFDYDGSVHIRVYDAEGNMIRDELRKR